MSNISQVEVNGTTYDICDATARDDITSLVKNEHQYDIDWTPLPLIDADGYGDTSSPIYARYGKIVVVQGAAKPKTAQTADATLIIGKLPEHYRPYNNVTILSQGSAQDQWCLTITGIRSLSNSEWGNLACARYQAGGTTKAYGTSTWLPFHAAFIAED